MKILLSIAMRSMLAFVLIVGSVLPMSAQPTLSSSPETKRLPSQVMADAMLAGQYNGLNCYVAQGLSEFAVVRKNDYVVMLADHNLEPLATLELPQSSQMRLLAASVNGEQLSALFCANEDNATALFSAVVDLSEMKLAGGATALSLVERFAYTKQDRCMVWGGCSANGQYFGVVVVVEYADQKQYSSVAIMLDPQFETQWRHDFAMGTMDQVWVTDQGMLLSLGYDVVGEENHLVVNLASKKRMGSYDMAVKCDPITNLRIANVTPSHLVALGTFTPTGADPDDHLCGGVVAMSFNTDSAALTNFFMRPFMNEDVNILYNENTKKKQRNQEVEMVSVLGTTPLSYGAAIALGHNFLHRHVAANGNMEETYYNTGVHLLVVDTMARIQFVRNLRRNDNQSSGNNLLRVGLFGHADQLCVVKSESPKLPATYDITKAAKEFDIESKSNLVLYTIAPNGDVAKQVLEPKSKYNFLRLIPSAEGKYMLLSANGKRSRLSQMQFE